MKKSSLVTLGAVALGAWGIARLTRSRYSLAGKVVVVTGGSRGLGLVLARQLCAEGARVALLARDAAELGRARAELADSGAEVLTLPCDITQQSAAERAIADIAAHFGGIDVLINNAGIIQVGPLEHMQRADFEAALAIHFWAPFQLIWAALPHLRRSGGGRIVNISSIGGKVGVPHLAPYCASKFALVGLSDSLRAELARDGIAVTTVAPGLMRTGSHLNAEFKGRHAAEFAWFAASASLPLLSMKAERAAALILEACRRGQPALTLTLQARGAVAANALFPNLTGHILKLVSRCLPQPGESEGDQARSGWGSRGASFPPRWLTRLGDRETERNNGLRGRAADLL